MLHSTNTRQVTEYIRKKYKAIQDCNAFSRSERLSIMGDRHAFAERLNSDALRISLSVEQSITRFNTPAWSVALSSARYQEQFLKKGISLYKHNCSVPTELTQAYSKSSSQPFPTSLPSCSDALRQVKGRVKSIAHQSFEQRELERDALISQLEQSSLSSDLKRAALLRKIRYIEKARQFASKMRMVRNSQVKEGMTRIEISVHPEQDPKRARLGSWWISHRKFFTISNSVTGNTSDRPSEPRLQSLR